MPILIDREGVQRLVAGGAQLLEVLPAAEFQEDHLPGAINIPLKELDRETTRHSNAGGAPPAQTPVTTSEGRLLGLLERDTSERAPAKPNRISARTLSEGSQP